MPKTDSNSGPDEQEAIECKQCVSQSQKRFSAEVALHFRGLAGLDKPIVWVFPNVSVCLECGRAEFTIPESEMQVLRTGLPVEGTAVWLGKPTKESAQQKHQ